MTNRKSKFVPPGIEYIAGNVLEKHNILGTSKSKSCAWAKDLNLPEARETIFFAGCGYQYSKNLEAMMTLLRKTDKSVVGSDTVLKLGGMVKKAGINAAGIYSSVFSKKAIHDPLKDAVNVLRSLDIDFGYLAEKEPCCGAILHFAGMEEDFRKNIESVFKQFEKSGVKRVIGIVPSCTYALRELARQKTSGSKIEVKHFTQVVAERMARRNWVFPKEVKATYHDPCQLGRFLGIIEEPRYIIKNIKNLTLVEPSSNREWATCCGGGGGFEAVFPELSGILAENRTRELIETGAEIIITNCPGCIMQIETGLKNLKVNNVQVLDISQVLAMAMEEKK